MLFINKLYKTLTTLGKCIVLKVVFDLLEISSTTDTMFCHSALDI